MIGQYVTCVSCAQKSATMLVQSAARQSIVIQVRDGNEEAGQDSSICIIHVSPVWVKMRLLAKLVEVRLPPKDVERVADKDVQSF